MQWFSLQHLIKNPDMISKVMDLDEEPDTPNLKLTRSKLKQLQCTNEVKLFHRKLRARRLCFCRGISLYLLTIGFTIAD